MSASIDPLRADAPARCETTQSPPGVPPDPELERLAGEVLDAMTAAWQIGNQERAELWFSRYPRLAEDPALGARIVFEEICLREEAGEVVEAAEIYARFPDWRGALTVVLDCHRLMGLAAHNSGFPEPGQKLGELRLLREMGRGGAGRVFLATQPSLSDRPLVVKLTPRSGHEHLSLARLQHTHIVPLYLVQDFPEQNLRALCMPYLGGISWWQVLQSLGSTLPASRSGKEIVQALAAGRDSADPSYGGRGPALAFLSRATYVEATCWIVSCLADGLHYAHERGLVHLDVKPSNVLLAADGQPMLLDFHLARQAAPAGSPIDRLGGTHGYMSPEQEQCATAMREGEAMPVDLDGRSDVYSLGLLLGESLCGRATGTGEPLTRANIMRANPAVSAGLADIVEKCVALDPGARYPDAGRLAADLRRHLANMPLQEVANRSLVERWVKWRRRKPHALLSLAAALAAVSLLVGGGWLFHTDRQRQAQSQLAQAKEDFDHHDFAAAVQHTETGWQAVRWFPWHAQLRAALKEQRAVSEAAERASALHQLVEQLNFVDSLQDLRVSQLTALEAGCRTIWNARQKFGTPAGGTFHIEPGSRLRTDLLDLALLWTRLRLRLSETGQTTTAMRQECLSVLDEAEELCGRSPVLDFARRDLSGRPVALNARSTDSERLPMTAWEHYALGRGLLETDQLAAAQQELELAVQLEPDSFWANFHLAVCAYRQEKFDVALTAASICVALAPDRGECYYNRALCRRALGQAQAAEQDLARAAMLDPTLKVE